MTLGGRHDRPSFKRSTSVRASKRKKDDLYELSAHCQNVQGKLQTQVRCLDARLEAQNLMVAEMQDFFKRRSEIELEYACKLEKLGKSYMSRQKQERREPGAAFSTYQCWQHLLGITKRQSKDHSLIADVFSTQMNARLGDAIEDSRRIFAKCKETALNCHEEITKVLNELQSDMKQYQVFNTQFKNAETKLRQAEEMKRKVEQQANKQSKKLKQLEKRREKRYEKYLEHKNKAVKARNVYLLSIDAANAATDKYFVDDLSLLMDSMDFGYHNSMQRSMLLYNSSLDNLRRSHQNSIDCIVKCVQELDPNKDKQTFLTANGELFTMPANIEFQPHRGDDTSQVSAQTPVQDDLLIRFQQINNRLDTLRLENEEVWKSIEAADRNLIEMINLQDYDLTALFKCENPVVKPPVTPEMKRRRLETEDFYFQKFRSYLLESNLHSRLLARHTALKKALGEEGLSRRSSSSSQVPARATAVPTKPSKPRRVGKTPIVGRPKVFGCNLEDYVNATEEAIPLVLRSCIRSINLYGMHHEGLFRVPGLQVEINDMKAAFEKGEDPLSDITDASSINSIAGVLKSFFRDLQEPLFPMHMFDLFVEAAAIREDVEAIERIKELLHTLSPQRFIIIRYLFAFLNHLSQYSDENLMYPYNLAICFGPTLLPIPDDKDQVAYQNYVNDLMKLIIVNVDSIFPKNEPGPVYERILLDPGIAFIRQSEAKFVLCLSKWSKAYRDRAAASSGTNWPSYKIWLSHENIRVATEQSDKDEVDGSDNERSDEEDPDVFEAVASFDFDGRSERELSFKKGDTIILYQKISADWWEGAHQGQEGLVPDKYVQLTKETVSTPTTPSTNMSLDKMHQSFSLAATSPKSRRPHRRSSDSQMIVPKPSLREAHSQPNLPVEEEDVMSSNLSLSHQLEGIGEVQESTCSTFSLEKVAETSTPTIEQPPTPSKHDTNGTVVDDLMQTSNESVTTEHMEEDIDNALAEVMSGLETLRGRAKLEGRQTDNQNGDAVGSSCTPDLVQNLPLVDANTPNTSPVGSYQDNTSSSLNTRKANSVPQISPPVQKRERPPSISSQHSKLSSFSRTISSLSYRECDPTPIETTVKPKPTITGRPIQARMPSVPSLTMSASSDDMDVSCQSLPATPIGPEPPFPKVRETLPERPKTFIENEENEKPRVSRRPPPPIKAKPKPPPLRPKPRK